MNNIICTWSQYTNDYTVDTSHAMRVLRFDLRDFTNLRFFFTTFSHLLYDSVRWFIYNFYKSLDGRYS